MTKVFSLSQEIITLFTQNNKTIFTAESCTAGLIAASLGEISGASKVLYGGIVSYDNSIKRSLLGVTDTILDNYGAVSFECVTQMAQGALALSQTNYVLAISGIAGPNGGTAQKPVGTVYTTIIDKNNCGWSQLFHFEGTRQEIQIQSVEVLLSLLLATEKEEEFFDLRLQDAREI